MTGMMGRVNERARRHLKSSSSPAKGVPGAGRAPTPSNIASPRSTGSPHKRSLFGRSAISKATAALRSAKSREKLRPEPEPEPEPQSVNIHSSPIRVQLDNIGKPACVRYIAHYLCDHIIIDQHPCHEHDPAFCLDVGHCVTRKMEKQRKCDECQRQEVAEMLVATEKIFPDRPMGVQDQPMKHSSPSRAAHAVIKSRIAKRIAELGPLGEVRSSPLSARQDKVESKAESLDHTAMPIEVRSSPLSVSEDKAESIAESAVNTGMPPKLLSLSDFLKEEVVGKETVVEKETGAATVPPLTFLPPAVVAFKKRLDGQVAAHRAVSEAHRATTAHQDKRASSASLRPLPPLPTPVNFDGFADNTFNRASASSQLPVGSHPSSDFSCGQKRDKYVQNSHADATLEHNLNGDEGASGIGFARSESQFLQLDILASHRISNTFQNAARHVQFAGSDIDEHEHNQEKGGSISRIDFAAPYGTNIVDTPQGQRIQFAGGEGEKHVHFLGDSDAHEHNDSTLLEDSDISTLNLDPSADDNDPFLDSVAQHMSTLSVSPRNERPLPPIPATNTARRQTLQSSLDGLDKFIMTFVAERRASQYEGLQKRTMPSRRSAQNFASFEPPADQPIQSSPTPNKGPKLPTTQEAFAAFDFHLGYERGKVGYIGRMGQKGSGDNFNRDWKMEFGTRDYKQDETATGELWENKHGFGYAGLKRYMNRLNEERKAKNKESSSKSGMVKSDSANMMMPRTESMNFFSPRPNMESTIWARRWSRNVGIPIPGPVLNFEAVGKTDLGAIVKNQSGGTEVLLKNARKHKYNEIPWDRTMIGCAL